MVMRASPTTTSLSAGKEKEPIIKSVEIIS